jgi:hypothetical protein
MKDFTKNLKKFLVTRGMKKVLLKNTAMFSFCPIGIPQFSLEVFRGYIRETKTEFLRTLLAWRYNKNSILIPI